MRAIPIAALLSFACLAQESMDARRELNLGVAEYKSARYDDAAVHFAEAARLDPNFAVAHLYLGTTYMMMYIPGSESAGNLDKARLALNSFYAVLKLDAENDVAIASIASLYFHQKKFDESADWYLKLTALKPDHKEAWYTLGVITWSQWYPALTKARADLGMKPEDPGPLIDDTVRGELKSKWSDKLDRGVAYLEKALGIDPAYDDAMAYMNLLIRERADLDDSKDDYLRDTATADDWVRKTLETKKRKAEAARR